MEKNIQEREQEILMMTEKGRLYLELDKESGEIEEYLQASMVGDDIKNKCREFINSFKEKIKKEELEYIFETENSPYALVLNLTRGLAAILDLKDEEQNSLYFALRDSIHKALHSAVGPLIQ